jgi:hypothetical protein
MTRNQDIAAEIARQLGGTQRLVAFCGAREFVAIENGLRFRVPSNMTKSRISHFTVVLTSEDLYDVKAEAVRGTNWKTIVEHKGVFCDQLMDLFEEATGMFLTLGARA